MIKPILKWPDNRLRKKCQEVTVFDEKLTQLVIDLQQTMTQYPKKINLPEAAGLAAPQIGVFKRVFVYIMNGKPTCMINPVILEKEGEQEESEGCLSFPGVYIRVKRADKILVEFQDVDGKKNCLKTDGFIARCIQHEIDHLDGKTYLHALSKVKRDFVTGKMKKLKKKTVLQEKQYNEWLKKKQKEQDARESESTRANNISDDRTGAETEKTV